MSDQVVSPPMAFDDASTELSSRRTGMSFQRTRMSADRTLMSVIRTSMSLLSFGFSIYQVFKSLAQSGMVKVGNEAPRNFGLVLISLGIGMLIVGIIYHLQFMVGLRKLRHELSAHGLIHGESLFPVSFTLIVALLLLSVGFLAIASIVLHFGPFQ